MKKEKGARKGRGRLALPGVFAAVLTLAALTVFAAALTVSCKNASLVSGTDSPGGGEDPGTGGTGTGEKTFTVTFDVNHGNEGGATYPPPQTVTSGKAVTLPEALWSGHLLTGWYTGANEGIKVGDEGSPYVPKADIALYAQWKAWFIYFD